MEKLSFEDLCKTVGLPSRTVRYYIQQGLIDRPEGVKRGAFYTTRHVDQLLMLLKWQKAGLSLDRIKELIHVPEEGIAIPVPPKKTGDISVRSHIHIAPGIEVVIDPESANLSPEDLRELCRRIIAAVTNPEGGATHV